MARVVGHEVTAIDAVDRVSRLGGVVDRVEVALSTVDRRIDFVQLYDDVMTTVDTSDGFRDSCLHGSNPRTLASRDAGMANEQPAGLGKTDRQL
jgi:hypothetical protein